MANLIEVISVFALDVISRFGYSGVFILSLLESAGIPIPSEVVVPFSGFLVNSGRFSFWPLVFVVTFANLVGSIILFFIGKKGFRWILENYGKYIFVSKKDLDISDEWFKKHGIKAVFFGRMLPIVRTFISLPAGIAEINFKKFVIFTFLGGLPWNFVLALIGVKAGENWNSVLKYFREFNIFIVALLVILIVWYILRHINNKHDE